MKIADMFDWKLKDLVPRLKDLKEQGFDVVQFSPIQTCKPGDWRFLFQNISINCFGNRLGSKEDWIKANKEAHRIGLKTCTSVQLRHVASSDTNNLLPHEYVPRSISKYIKGEPFASNDRNRKDVTEGFWGLPRLDYDSIELTETEYFPFLDVVLNHSDFVRLDEGKHIGLPSEGYHFWERMNERYGKRIIAECINEVEHILKEYAEYCLVLTEEGTPCPKGTVRFVESHDTFLNDWGYTKHLSSDEILNKFECSCKLHHNVMFYARPFDDTIFSHRMNQILHNPNNKC